MRRWHTEDVDGHRRTTELDLDASLVHDVDLSSDQVGQAAQIFGMLAEPSRLLILWTLVAGPSNVSGLTAEVGASRTSVSQHLAKLRAAGLVDVERQGREQIYSVRGGHVERLLREAFNHADHTLTGEPPHV